MIRNLFGGIAIAVATAGSLQAAGPQQSPTADAATYRAVLNRYCVTCHNDKLKTAGLLLDKMDVDKVSEGAPVWEKVARKLRTRSMPPAGAPRPDNGTYDSFATYLETALDNAAAAKPNPGRPAVHRLNRTEYANAVRDMLALEIDARSLLPADDAGYGFDNIADALSVSPGLLERYVSAATKVSRLAVGDPGVTPSAETFEISEKLRQADRVSEDLPFGSRGGMAIRYRFPLDGEYSVKIRLRTNNNRYIYGLQEGLGEPHQLEVSVDGTRIKTFTIGGERKGKKRTVNNSASDGDEEDPDIKKYELTADEGLEVRFPALAGTRTVAISFVRPGEPEGIFRPQAYADPRQSYKGGDPEVSSVTLAGPYNAKGLGDTASRRKIFLCRPTGGAEDSLCAKKILSTLVRRAYRRPVTDEDVQPLVSLYQAGQRDGGFEAGIEMALESVLVSPEFLFRIESDPVPPSAIAPGAAYRVTDLDLASRLSFFLWSTIPDDPLLSLAARGKLKDREVLQQQVRRMLADPRSKALVQNFAGQWLLLRNMSQVIPDEELYPDFDDNLRQAFEQETSLFFESMLREDHSVLDLLSANYTFVNERLARHYGIPDIHGSNFRRVTVTEENRKGLLGQGSLLTLTSYATRTSVVLRGKWLLENILGTPPPPPPPNVPSLTERSSDGKILSVRQQMERHRANPACSGCHSRMDPLGFALENFDAIGKWRTTEGAANNPIDSSGALTDGTKFQGPAELRKVLLRQPEQFSTVVTEKLLTYALGRQIDYYDAPAVRKIVREAAPNYRWSSLIYGIINSTPFQMRRSPEP
jgi:mono/diheme cytochrome c family protein